MVVTGRWRRGRHNPAGWSSDKTCLYAALGGLNVHLSEISVLVIVPAFLAMYVRKVWLDGSTRTLAIAS
jgi:hypothetical protein